MTQDGILIHPIRTDEDHRQALARIEELWGSPMDSREGDELDILLALVDWFETEHFPMNHPTPQTTILVRMEEQGLTRKDLEPMIGSRARVSEVLSGKRRLTLDMIRRLHEGLGIPLESLISPNIEGLQPTGRRRTLRVRKTAPGSRARSQSLTQSAG